jgi:PAS domain-containing protein
VLLRLDNLRTEGVSDLRLYLDQHPEDLSILATSLRVNRVNPATLKLFKAKTESDLIRNIETTFGSGARETFKDVMCAIWDGQRTFRAETSYRALDGTLIDCIISIPIPAATKSTQHVPVSIVDISLQKQTEKALFQERQRLQEVIWGTDVGTWEWNIQTGVTVFNQRWAEIIGYTLEEISPVTIET